MRGPKIRDAGNSIGRSDRSIHTKDVPDQICVEDLLGRGKGDLSAFTQDGDSVAITPGLGEIVEDGDGGTAVFDRLTNLFEEVVLVKYIQVCGRLVEKEEIGVLDQSLGEEDPLQLTAAQ